MKANSELSEQSYLIVFVNTGSNDIHGTFHSQDLDLKDLTVCESESTPLESQKSQEARKNPSPRINLISKFTIT